VASNTVLRKTVSERFGAFFAEPEYSSDNAAGIARLTEMRFRYGG
jgi:N6-L-threonylcarbamoyladenine synthase